MNLNGREQGALFWLLALVIFVLSKRDTRRAAGGVLKAATPWKLWLPFLLLSAYAVAIVAMASHLGWWSTTLLKATIIWFLGTATALYLHLDRAMKEPRFFRTVAFEAIGLSALVQFLAGLYPFSVFVEVPLQAVLMLLVGVGVVAKQSEETRTVGRLSDGVVASVGLLLLVASVTKLIQIWSEVSWSGLLKEFALPIWATSAILPFIYALALVAAYELQHTRMTFVRAIDDSPTQPRRALLALVVGAHVRLRQVMDLTHRGRREMVLAPTFKTRMRAFRQDQIRRRVDEQPDG